MGRNTHPRSPKLLFCVDIYKITLFGYTLPYYIGVILRRGTQNHSYIIWEWQHLYSVPLRISVLPGVILCTPRKITPILYITGVILRTLRKILHMHKHPYNIMGVSFAYPMLNHWSDFAYPTYTTKLEADHALSVALN